MEWLKKNIILAVFQFLTLLMLGIVSWGATSFYSSIENKVGKNELNKEIQIIDTRIKPIEQDIDELKRKDSEIQKMFLDEIRSLREDLRLKQDKHN